MNIQQQNGVVSTINFAPYSETEASRSLRKTLFDRATAASNVLPINRIDAFDETILIFESFFKALDFMCHLFRSAVLLENQTCSPISLRSSLCAGDYFVHGGQIYGDAINLATKLSYTSRENELLVCGIDSDIISEFIKSQNDISYFVRDQKENCISIGLYDKDSTNAATDNSELKVTFNQQIKNFISGRSQRIQIGRSENSDIYIDSQKISRSHATMTLNYDDVFIEDHSANGTYLYLDDREIFLTNERLKLSNVGNISCGVSMSKCKNKVNVISYSLSENTIIRNTELLAS